MSGIRKAIADYSCLQLQVTADHFHMYIWHVHIDQPNVNVMPISSALSLSGFSDQPAVLD